LHHLGRLDAQVKVRGIRVDPGEVESQLLRHAAVVGAAVLGVQAAGRTALAAYVVPADGRPDADLAATLRAFLREHAPPQLQPARITVVPALVLTSSGKVDRRGTHDQFGLPPHQPVPL
jgi:nonribosomal peptide synthetase protein VioO